MAVSNYRAWGVDGGAGLGDALRRQFPFLVEIRDFWRVKEYLVKLSQQLSPRDAARRAEWLTSRRHELKHAGVESVRRTLEQLPLPPTASPQLQATLEKTLKYFRNHEAQMDYPQYVSGGWQIGSGPVEAACKHIVKTRLCGPGMRWHVPCAESTLRLRCLRIGSSSPWQAFFSTST